MKTATPAPAPASAAVPSKATPVQDDKTEFGFWLYLMTDCVLFATLFAVYAVQHGSTNGGPGAALLFTMPNVLIETLVLLTSSFTCGLALVYATRRQKNDTLMWLAITAVLGVVFLVVELSEFRQLVADGNSWRASGFLSAFFTLVGTHGLHITIGLLWIISMFAQVLRKGFGGNTVKRLRLFSMFWHFLDLVWIFIFSVVYLLGVA